MLQGRVKTLRSYKTATIYTASCYIVPTNKHMPAKAIVIGSGIAGIATAIRLAVMGYSVKVFEANPYPGGKLTAFNQEGFRFDAGPSLFTMPHLVDELFVLAGRSPKDHFTYTRQEEACRYFWEDGVKITAWADVERFANEVSQKLGVKPDKVTDALLHSRKLYELTGETFTEKSLHKAGTWLSGDVVKALGKIFGLDIMTTMHKANAKRLEHPKLVQLFDRFATYNGSSPYKAPGILNMIPHLEHNMGTYFPDKGMHSITESLVALAEDLGVQFYLNEPVQEILHSKEEAYGVKVAGNVHMAEVIVSNMDVVPTYRRLLPNTKPPEKVLQQERSGSAVIFYWGMQEQFPELGLHNIFFSEDYRSEFDHIFQLKSVSTDPTVYVHISNRVVKADAPPGTDNWFVMVNVPADEGQYWEQLIPQIRANVIAKLQRILGKSIESKIANESVLDPRGISMRTSSWKGALYGAASNNKYAAFLRHPNFHRKIKGLYFCGGSVHPGGGIPLCLLSAKITADLISNSK